MKTAYISACLAVLIAAPAVAEQHTADPTADFTDTPNYEPAELPQPADDGVSLVSCDAGAHADLLGKTGAEIETMKFDVPVRVIPENGVVTMDFIPDRVNFELDADGTVSEISCG